MTTFIKYPSIQNLKNATHDLMKNCGLSSLNLPTINLKGTVKIHGTNAGICIRKDSVTAQSRNRIITPEDDNAGFASFVKEHEDVLSELKGHVSEDETLVLFGEWCGGNIQDGVGVTDMPKTFVVFSCRIYEDGSEGVFECDNNHITECIKNRFNGSLYSIKDFKTFEYTLDLSSQESINGLNDFTLAVEKECPVALALNPEGNLVGEGIVWEGFYKDCLFKFKHKGDKHQRGSGSKSVKVKTSLSDSQLKAVKDFLEIAVSNDRLLQGKEYLTEIGLDCEAVENTGEYIKWFMKDINKECKAELEDLYSNHQVELKTFQGDMVKVVRNFYLN